MKLTLVIMVIASASLCAAIPRQRRATDEHLSNEVIPTSGEATAETSSEVLVPEVVPENTETTKTPALDDVPTRKPGGKPTATHPASPVFSRVIDDIFNIPISVLRAVNTLLSNAFGTKQTSLPTPATELTA